ncbi:MAG: mucoidy inhibitor MuiA family protein [Thermodesulfobacteriota bacterium]|nr:mucoidy inhibitor MuiA family protein [Thermodesulfobacteriota bacterium]
MKYLLQSALIVFFSLLASTTFAKPTEIILYPSGATISEQATILQGTDSATLLLPHVAIPESLKLALQKATKQKITGIEYESVLPEDSDSQELIDLISRLQQEINAVDDQIQSRTLALTYWKSPQDLPVKTLADAREMGKIIREESIILLQATTQLRLQKTELAKQLREAQNQLQKKTGKNQRNWQVQVRLSQPATADLKLVYSYRIRRAGWQSSYSLNAFPGKNKVQWIWTAKIMQQTGIDWNGVALKIATTEPVFTLTPPQIRSWEIAAAQAIYARSSMKMKAMPQTITLDAVAENSIASVPVRTEGQLFDIYDLGQVNIASGKESRIKIREGHWGAKFTYLARPLLSEQVFLEAELNLSKNFLPLPTGIASIQVNGVHVGQRNFSLHEKQDINMSFGSDPSIGVDVQTDHIAGEKGLLAKKRTYNWNWTINLVNHKNFAVELKVEDTYPHSGHEKIMLQEFFSQPLPVREKDQLIWNLTVSPQGTQQIQYGYGVVYPEDLPVSLGR